MQYIVKLSGYYGSSEFYAADTLFNVLFYIDIDIVLGYNIIRLIVSIIKSILIVTGERSCRTHRTTVKRMGREN